MTWLGLSCGTQLRRKSGLGSPVAKTGSRPSTNSSTVRQPLSSNQTTRSREENNSNKGNQGSLRKVAIRNEIVDHPSPNQRKTLPAIPMTPAVIPVWASPISRAEASGPTYHQCHGFQRKPTKAERQTGNAPAAAAESTKPTFVPNTARQTHLNRTPAIAVAAMTANKLNDQGHSTCSSKKTSHPPLISNSTGEAGRYGVRIGKLRKPNLICNVERDTTAPNCLKIKSHSGRSGSDVKPIPMRHRETGFGAYRPWSPCMKHTRQHAASQSTNQLRCNEHLYITEPTQETQIAPQTSSHLHPGSQWPSDDVCKGEPKGKSLGSVFWTP